VKFEKAALPLLARSAIFVKIGGAMVLKTSWKTERKSYIKNKCLMNRRFKGRKKEIYSHNGKWFIMHTDQFGRSSEVYGENLDEAVADYVALEERYGKDEV
jgi:hypothetical protein